EQIAPPGGICLSEDAYRQVRGKIEIPITDGGEQNLKNISHPIRVYRIEPATAAAFETLPPPTAQASQRWSRQTIAGAAATAAVVLAAVIGFALLREQP